MSDPRELAAVVREALLLRRPDDHEYGTKAHIALARLDALVAECEQAHEQLSWHVQRLSESTRGYEESEARARRYEEALREIANGGMWSATGMKRPARVVARAALAEEEA